MTAGFSLSTLSPSPLPASRLFFSVFSLSCWELSQIRQSPWPQLSQPKRAKQRIPSSLKFMRSCNTWIATYSCTLALMDSCYSNYYNPSPLAWWWLSFRSISQCCRASNASSRYPINKQLPKPRRLLQCICHCMWSDKQFDSHKQNWVRASKTKLNFRTTRLNQA